MTNLLPTHLSYPTDDNTTRELFSVYYKLHELGYADTLVYPKGFNLNDDSIPVWILYHDDTEDGKTVVLQTHIHPTDETILSDDNDTLRIYKTRKDAYSYVERISRIL